MPQPTLFDRLRLYRPSYEREAREDRLTEALAATLEVCPDLARHLAQAWFNEQPTGDLTVATQRWVGPTERLDLELVFGRSNPPELRIWIEAKVDAQPVFGQVDRYKRLLDRRPERSHLSWLLPIGVHPVGGSPADVQERTWQDLAFTVVEWLGRQAEDAAQSYSTGLARELVRHLEDEERLAMTTPLTDADVAALDGHETASARLQAILEIANGVVHQKRKRLDGRLWTRRSPYFWETVTGGAQFSRRTVYQWYGDADIDRITPEGRWVIGAGATWDIENVPSERDNAEWYDRLYSKGFELSRPKRGAQHLSRYLTLPQLAAPGTLTEQGQALGDWASETWDILDANPF